jgi:cytochrome P450
MYRALLADNPISWQPLREMWVLARYEDVDYMLTQAKTSADRSRARNRFAEMMQKQQQENFGPFNRAPTMLTSDPPEHTRLRRLVSRAFTPRAVENLRPRIQQIVDELLDEAEKNGRMDLVMDLAYPLPVIVIAEMLGVPPEDRARFKKWSDAVVATLGGPFQPEEVLRGGRQAIEELAEYLDEIIAERRKEPRADLISGLLAAEEQGQVLSQDEIMTTSILLLVAGNETTTHLIDNGTLALLRNPDQLRSLQDDPSLMAPAVEELLRFAGPVQATGRVLMEDVTIDGNEMKEGQIAFLLLGAANRDPAKWADPDRLDLRRNPSDHVALGDGIHFCLGAPLARAEAQIAIGTLIRRFPKLRLEIEEPEWGGTFIIRGVKHLPVSW